MSGAGSGPGVPTLETPRLRLRPWRENDRDAFARLVADPDVMADLGGPIDRRASDAKLDNYMATLRRHEHGRMAIEDRDGTFLGYAGVMPHDTHALGAHFDVGWRLARAAWGHGYATEAAQASLRDAFQRIGLSEVLAYTAPDNLRSQAVMRRLGLARAPERDFTIQLPKSPPWHGLVWVARPT